MQAHRQWNDIFKVFKVNNYQPRVICSEKYISAIKAKKHFQTNKS